MDLHETASKAIKRLEAMDPDTLGPAGQILLGYEYVKCEHCNGLGTVKVRNK